MKRSRTSPLMVMPILSAGKHRTPRQGACFMEFASYLAGEKWSDHPACTHPVVAALARDINDLSSDATRGGLTGHIHRVVGLTSDDPMFTATIAVHAACAALPIASLERQQALAVGMLVALASVDSPELESRVEEAFRTAPDSGRWARKHLSTSRSREFTVRTAISMVHTAAVGIALACVPDADERLGQLLASTIEVAVDLQGASAADAVTSEQFDTMFSRERAEIQG